MKFLQFLEDTSGGFSAMRLAMLAWIAGLLVIWCFISYKEAKLQPIPESLTTIIGILVSGKVVQRFGENQTPENKS
jgi:hypothetical protein